MWLDKDDLENIAVEYKTAEQTITDKVHFLHLFHRQGQMNSTQLSQEIERVFGTALEHTYTRTDAFIRNAEQGLDQLATVNIIHGKVQELSSHGVD